jgi:hypothetical protein
MDVQEVIGLAENKNMLPSESLSGSRIGYSDRDAEPMVEYFFELFARSLAESEYSEYSEDIIHIVKSAFEPKEKIACGEIAKMVTEWFKSEEARQVDLEESFEDGGVLLAKALTDVSVAIGNLRERMARIEETVSSIEKQVMIPYQKMRRKDPQWQEM